jgi:opacity protein-like surface antigen
MKALLLVSVVFALTLANAASADVAGTYTGGGTNPGGAGSYDCDVVITKTGDVYSVQWYFGGALGYDGAGIMKNGLFCVGFASQDGYGVVVYEIGTDGSLSGVWTMAGADELGTETLKKK